MPASAQQELFFTYIGATIGGGAASIDYSEWVVDHRETASATGTWFSGGLLLDVIVRDLIGEYSLQVVNTGASEDTVASFPPPPFRHGEIRVSVKRKFFPLSGPGALSRDGPVGQGL